jgi:hypothetical protein
VALACATAALPIDLTQDPSSEAGTDGALTGDAGCPQYDISTDPKHCGTCTHACTTDQVCVGGACKAQCTLPQVKCAADGGGSACFDTTSDPSHCGQCGNACSTADAGDLLPGTNNPDSGVSFDGGYDAGIGWTLGTPTCAKSACGINCPGGFTACSDEICYDTQNFHDHCGDCNTACAMDTEWCTTGHCCSVGMAYCGSACVDMMSDDNNCGWCGHTCTGGQTCGGGVCAACVALAGPALTTNIGGWPTAGLRIKALKNTTLSSFVFNNQGLADTVELTDTTGSVLQTLATPASSTAYTASVSWSLTSGTSYDLVSLNGSNGRWVSYSSYPTSGTSLEVDGEVNNTQTVSTSYWFTFTNIKTCP